MQYTTNYNLITVEGTDVVNPLVQMNPNFTDIDAAMFANKQAVIGSATEITSGTVHSITRANTDSNYFRFTATSNWTLGDSMSVDGVSVSVYLSDGTAPTSGAYVINSEVLALLSGTRVTLITSNGVATVAANDVTYDNTVSGLSATDAQNAIDEVLSIAEGHGMYEFWNNTNPSTPFAAQSVLFSSDLTLDGIVIVTTANTLNYIEVGTSGHINRIIMPAYSHLKLENRDVTVSVSGNVYTVSISDCDAHELNSYGSTATASTSNGSMIPVRILGLVHNS